MRKLRVLLTRKSFVRICILLVEQLAERGAKPRSAIREILDLFRPPAEDKDKIDEGDLASANDYARMYWEQRLQLCDGDSEAELRVLLRLSRHSLQGKKMVGVSVSGAGVLHATASTLVTASTAAARSSRMASGGC